MRDLVRHRAWLQEGETDLSLPSWMRQEHAICSAYQTGRGEKTAERQAERSLPLPLLGSRNTDEGDSLEHLTSTHEEGREDPSTRLSQRLNRSSLLPT